MRSIIGLLGLAFALAACSKHSDSSGDSGSGDPYAAVMNGVADCSSGPLFNQDFIDLTQISAINPLGDTGTSHVIPSDHPNVFLVTSGGMTTATPVFAPAALRVVKIERHHETGATTFDLYKVTTAPCRQYNLYFDHLTSLSTTLSSAYDSASKSCQTYSSNGYSIEACSAYLSIDLAIGATLGNAGGDPGGVTAQNQPSFDIGSFDGRIADLSFANPARWPHLSFNWDEFHVSCPFDAYGSSQKSAYDAKLGYASTPAANGSCGRVDVDVAGTAQGDWYDPANASDQSSGVSLTLNTLEKNGASGQIEGRITVGQGFGSAFGKYLFDRTSSGTTNRNFAEVTEDGNVYCYQHLTKVGSSYNGIFILQLVGGQLKIEPQSGGSSHDCANGGSALAFTGAAITYPR